MFRIARAMCGLLLAVGVITAKADDCRLDYTPGANVHATIARALAVEPNCLKSAPFLFALGQQFNIARDYQAAADRLERAIMLAPGFWEAQLEYAIALEGLGDAPSATAWLAALSGNPEVSPEIQRDIHRQIEKRRDFQVDRRIVATRLAAVTGYDNNLLGGTRVSSFDLTLAGSRLPVRIADEAKPKAGFFTRFDLAHEGYLGGAGDDMVWSYLVNANLRYVPEYSPANFGLLSVQLERGRPEKIGLYLSAGYVHLQTADYALLRQTQLGAGYDFSANGGACKPRAALDLVRRSYPEAEVLNGNYVGLQGYWVCPPWGMQVMLKAGQDRPEYDNRPGGIQNQYSLRIGKNATWGKGTLAAEIDLYHQTDARGYSPFLENNIKRNINRMIYRLEYRMILSDLSPYVGIEAMEQESSLPLYKISNQVVYFGIRKMW